MNYSDELHLPSKVFLYDEPSSDNLRLKDICGYIRLKTGLDVRLRKAFLSHYRKKHVEDLAGRFAAAKVRNLEKMEECEPMQGEVNIEKRMVDDPNLKLPGVLYDGFKLHRIFQSLMQKSERTLENAHLIFTNRLFATFDENDRRYHARVIICGYPSIISTSGIVEAPAKPRGFYVAKQKLGNLGFEAVELIREHYKGEFIDYDDERLTEVMKGYAMQALFYHFNNEPFCDRKRCRLFNAHWQSEVIRAQLGGDRYCARHREILEKVKHGTGNR